MKMKKKALVALILAAVLIIMIGVYVGSKPKKRADGSMVPAASSDTVTQTEDTTLETGEEITEETSEQAETEIVEEAEIELEEGEASGGM